jgi:hypothetical protein
VLLSGAGAVLARVPHGRMGGTFVFFSYFYDGAIFTTKSDAGDVGSDAAESMFFCQNGHHV